MQLLICNTLRYVTVIDNGNGTQNIADLSLFRPTTNSTIPGCLLKYKIVDFSDIES